ncbi:hypothetical protein EIP91_002564 [Steccherinum ochraceum]|uniref:Uncharacterized protein n=1 Tax=Steccherinum ochraceum TaxID=92696 RepID=A0A4R0RBS8_9APHY|nr:hypothetical protein EIP91_002564 [Steccherinum ochraceum]
MGRNRRSGKNNTAKNKSTTPSPDPASTDGLPKVKSSTRRKKGGCVELLRTQANKIKAAAGMADAVTGVPRHLSPPPFVQNVLRETRTGVMLEPRPPLTLRPGAGPPPPPTMNRFKIRRLADIRNIQLARAAKIKKAVKMEKKRERDRIVKWAIPFIHREATFLLPDGKTVAELEARNHKEPEYLEACRVCEELADPSVPARVESGAWKDASGKYALVVLSMEQMKDHQGNPLFDSEGEPIPLFSHNIHKRAQDAQQTRLQAHNSKWKKTYDHITDSKRHPEPGPIMPYLQQEVEGGPLVEKLEDKRVDHIFDRWHIQGHPSDGQVPSMDLRGRSREEFRDIVRTYYGDSQIHENIKHITKEFFPEDHDKLERVYKEGSWVPQEFPAFAPATGLFLGRIILWKLQTSVHLDDNDVLCAIWCCGQFTGGHAYIPDLKLKLRYAPGDLIVFHSRFLWHMIGPWLPKVMAPGSPLTPGRVSMVYTTHVDTARDILAKKIPLDPHPWTAAS